MGVVHRDLKPSNVFLADDRRARAGRQGARLRSGGRRSVARERHQLTGEYVIGSPAYMAPEQMIASSNVDARSDIWSMGVVLYELLTGQLPFRAHTPLEMFAAVMTRPPIPLAARFAGGLPPAGRGPGVRCLRKDRADRYPSMRALAGELRALAAGP